MILTFADDVDIGRTVLDMSKAFISIQQTAVGVGLVMNGEKKKNNQPFVNYGSFISVSKNG